MWRCRRSMEMVVTMSGPGNPYDNARCERFMLTLNG
jgi:transposase InsO family protein